MRARPALGIEMAVPRPAASNPDDDGAMVTGLLRC